MASNVWFSRSVFCPSFLDGGLPQVLQLRGLAGGFLGEGQSSDSHSVFFELRELQSGRASMISMRY